MLENRFDVHINTASALADGFVSTNAAIPASMENQYKDSPYIIVRNLRSYVRFIQTATGFNYSLGTYLSHIRFRYQSGAVADPYPVLELNGASYAETNEFIIYATNGVYLPEYYIPGGSINNILIMFYAGIEGLDNFAAGDSYFYELGFTMCTAKTSVSFGNAGLAVPTSGN